MLILRKGAWTPMTCGRRGVSFPVEKVLLGGVRDRRCGFTRGPGKLFGPYRAGWEGFVGREKGQPPSHLSAAARRLWRSLYATHVIDLPASQLLLTSLCEAFDRGAACRAALNGQPMTITDKHGGVRVHPLVVEERQCREQVARLARVLRIH